MTHELWDFESPLVVAVSGGMDSMAILHVLTQLASDASSIITVAHFDHASRDSSIDDANFVAETCRLLKLPYVTTRSDGNRPKGRSPEEHWRRERYQFLEQVRKDRNAIAIATAHTADDQVETVIYRLLMGTGPRGLAGMQFRNKTNLIRPFLTITRQCIAAFVEHHGILYRQDPTNENIAYPRNYIRHEILPHFQRISTGYQERIQSLIDLLHEEDNFMAAESDTLLKRAGWNGTVPAHLQCSIFAVAHPALLQCAALGLYQALDPSSNVRMTRDHVTRLVDVFLGSRKNLSLPADFLIRELRGTLHLFRVDPNADLPDNPVVVPEAGSITFGTMAWTLTKKEIAGTSTSEEPGIWLDPLDGPFQLRRRMKGDRYHPPGKSHGLSLKDFFNGISVPSELRDQVPLLINGRDEIVAVIVPGRAGDARHIPKPRLSLKLTWEPI